MSAARLIWMVSILFLSFHCPLAGADDTVGGKTQVQILNETLASLNLANPIADLDANFSKGDKRFIGINGYTCSTPGIGDENYSLIHSTQYGVRCLPGTSDNIESDYHKALIEKASAYAKKYNGELFRRIYTGMK